jgi:hypothetical protein
VLQTDVNQTGLEIDFQFNITETPTVDGQSKEATDPSDPMEKLRKVAQIVTLEITSRIDKVLLPKLTGARMEDCVFMGKVLKAMQTVSKIQLK